MYRLPPAGRGIPALECIACLDRRVAGGRCNAAGGYRGRNAAAPIHRAAVGSGVPGNSHRKAFAAIVTAPITIAIPVILVVCGGVITVAAGLIHTMLRAGIGPVVIGPVVGFSGRINSFITLSAVGFISVITAVILAKTVPEAMIFLEIIHFLSTITADFRYIMVVAVVVLTVIRVPAVAAGGIPATRAASRVAAKRTGVAGKSVGICGNTIGCTTRRTGNMRSVIVG